MSAIIQWISKAIRLPWRIAEAGHKFTGRKAPAVGICLAGYHGNLGGVGNYAMSLMRAWPTVFPWNPLRIFCTKQNFVDVQRLPFVCRIEQRFLVSYDDLVEYSGDCDFIYYPCASLEPIPPPAGAVFHLADLQEWFFPENFSEVEHCRRRNRYRSLLAYAEALFVPSEFTRRCVIELLGFDASKVITVPLLSGDMPKSGQKPASVHEAQFLFFPADDYAHKGHNLLISALNILHREGIKIPLICTGSRVSQGDWLESAKKNQLPVTHLGRVSREEIRWLYDHATALVFPSQFEGFGIPILEAMQCGTTVICSNFSSIPEVGGDAVEYFDPSSPEDLARTLKTVWCDKARREQLGKLGRKQADKFETAKVINFHAQAFDRLKKRNFLATKRSVNLPKPDPLKAWALTGRDRPLLALSQGKMVEDHTDARLPINFVTIVLNGMPFLPVQWEKLQSLECEWHWHVVEGASLLAHDTAWSKKNGGVLSDEFHRSGLSNDGTSEFLDTISGDERVSIYRTKGFWDGKMAMCQAPLSSISEESLLWQLDADEFWDAKAIQEVATTFSKNHILQAAQFRCRFFVSPDRVLDNVGFYGNNPEVEWKRVWRFQPGDSWKSHEPPVLERGGRDLFCFPHLTVEDTAMQGWVFDHMAYVTESQVRFKESYYGYGGATEGWRSLCESVEDEIMVSQYLPWVPPGLWCTRLAQTNSVFGDARENQANRSNAG